MGRKKRPFYRIVAADTRSPRDGRYIESVGRYNPLTDPPAIEVDEERVNYWLDNGAIPSDTVRSLFSRLGMMHKRYLLKRGYDEATLAEEMKKWEALQIQRKERLESKAGTKQKEKETKKADSEEAKARMEEKEKATAEPAEEEAKAETGAETEAAAKTEESQPE